MSSAGRIPPTSRDSALPGPPQGVSPHAPTPVNTEECRAERDPTPESAVDTVARLTHQAYRVEHAVEHAPHAVKQAATALARAHEVTKAKTAPPPAAVKAMGTDAAAALTPAQVADLTEAIKTLDAYRERAATAEHAAQAHAKAAQAVTQAAQRGTTSTELRVLQRGMFATAAIAEEAGRDLRGLEKGVRSARDLLKSIQAGVRQTRLSSALLSKIAQTETAHALLTSAAKAADSRFIEAVTTIADSKVVRVSGKVLFVASVAIDGYLATRPTATVSGNVVRFGGQAGTTLLQASTPGMLPVALLETFVFDKPHITGTTRVLPQVLGVAADYLSGDHAAGDLQLQTLDAEMKLGTYGSVIKAANFIGDGIAERGVGTVLSETLDYWSHVSARQALRDTKDFWNWLGR